MTKLRLLLRERPRGVVYASETEFASSSHEGVQVQLKRCSAGRRVELMERLAAYAAKYEALKASQRMDDKVQAEALRIRMDFEYLDWGLLGISGLLIDGETPDARVLFERGPETLVAEIVGAIRQECEFSEDERKN
jgi:hypothetical protein